MTSGVLIGLELALVIGVALGLGVWQLWSLRRERERDLKSRPPSRKPSQAPPPGRGDRRV